MKKLLCCLLCLSTLFCLCACAAKQESPSTTTSEVPTTTAPKTEEPNMLNGKKIIFVGNSYTYYGRAVMEKARGVLFQKDREKDKGYFYQLCKLKGADVEVTNWTFGGHNFKDLFVECAANRDCDGVCHQNYLEDRNFDYVVLQQSGSTKMLDLSAEDFLAQCDEIMAFFREANPDVKFLFLVQYMVHEKNFPWRSAIKGLAERGVTVVDWGALVYDVMNGTTAVPGGTQEYNRNSFVICQSKSDGFHPNLLTGYITSLMTYCAITGESAIGQPSDFCSDTSLSGKFSFPNYVSTYYSYNGGNTNFPQVFESKADIQGLQELMDRYLQEQAYQFY